MRPILLAIAIFQTVAWHAVFHDATGKRTLRRRVLLHQIDLAIGGGTFAFFQISPENEQPLAKLLQSFRVSTETVMGFLRLVHHTTCN